ncbi:GNAT family N-acetyltransferase [Haloplanus aerogenes]|uniref:GNAT family N-acetyltransferase n=1 Tax=Haloplanus aerogenes TaxID=660522 RepID=A0A3M0CTH2_9EURY|nr:GNAT family N-acetyltransferase [Haloplanus aerogenes]AZH26530.1 GNAT family N-acetyltransferase [Haloplanus aerogenes]RMB12758.1 ribosomal protein S18 acetylase RimI-like enzyme [Haloplanus aerogenes]
MQLRPARPDDHDDVVAFTRDTWPEQELEDYLPRTFREWAANDDDAQRTLVVDDDGDAVGVIQGVHLTGREAWVQGLRVHPDYRDRGLAQRLTNAILSWARERGAVVCRNLVFSWNVASLGLARRLGFEPATEIRWARIEADADADPSLDVTADPDAGWTFWTDSAARERLRGLTIHPSRAWTLSELRPADLERAAEAEGLFVVRGGGTRGMALRNRVFEAGDDDPERWTEYAVGAWADLDAARALVDAVARDAARLDADRARMLIPETPRFVTDAAAARADVSGDPDFVLAADLTDPDVGR